MQVSPSKKKTHLRVGIVFGLDTGAVFIKTIKVTARKLSWAVTLLFQRYYMTRTLMVWNTWKLPFIQT